MKAVCLIFLSISTVLVVASTARAQVIPRVGRTRPAVICEIPTANYQLGDRSSSIAVFSNRFVYVDDPLAELIRPPTAQTQQSTKITSVTKSIEVPKGVPNNAQVNSGSVAADQFRSQGNLPDPNTVPIRPENTSNRPLNGSVTPDTTNNSEALPSLILNNLPSSITSGEMTERTTLKNQTVLIPESASNGDIQRHTKLFQWNQDTLQIDQCAVSNIALQIGRNGVWVLNLRADQNRVPETGSVAAFNPRLHIKRNRFAIRLRCYGLMTTTPPEFGLKTGKPLLATIDVDDFWVENGQPKFLHTCDCNNWVRGNFDLIERVEIEFFYYK
ncbi:MAG: hypothetical protein ABL888_04710 [Pirellulaceae bacterium]